MKFGLVDLIFAVSAGLIVSSIVYLLRRAIRAYTYALLFAFAGACLIPVCLAAYACAKGIALSMVHFFVMVGALGAQAATIILLYCFMRRDLGKEKNQAIRARDEQNDALLRIQESLIREHSGRTEQQYDDDPFRVQIEERHRISKRTISIRRLQVCNLQPDGRLYLNAKTFSDGLKFLQRQIDDYAPTIHPCLCVGINITGGIMATFFSRSFGPDVSVGFVRTEGPFHEVTECLLPSVRKAMIILVTDLEMKGGQSMKNVVRLLKEKYGTGIHVYIAVLVASQVRESIGHMEELAQGHKGAFGQDRQYLPDFLAFTSSNKVRLYGNIR
ncbi:MAG: hypothetical protein ACYTEQ_12165 [Planctomycetota bacterium]|jgi:hypothetical protein